MPTRRRFLETTGFGAIGIGLAGPGSLARTLDEPFPKTKDPKYREWSAVALKEAKRLGCTYADIRFTRNRSHGLHVRNGQLHERRRRHRLRRTSATSETYGFGVRVIHSGVWGFCEQPDRDARGDPPHRPAVATDVAKASAMAKKFDVQLAPVPAYDTFWETPITTDPCEVPLEDKLALLVDDDRRRCRRTRTCCSRRRTVNFNHEWKFLATSRRLVHRAGASTTRACGTTRDGALDRDR